ncbi:ABC transporter permease [Streptomyces sp. G45]|uniref:ABC transporter permease n=1 Tax=Streptomyces sp. G45 TaxID=3406627 RepID=UPI003C15AEDF
MTTTDTRPVRPPARGPAVTWSMSPPARAMLVLTLCETRRLLRHPALLLALAAYLAHWFHTVTATEASRYPVLHDEARTGQAPLLLLAAGTFLAVHLAALRPVRDHTDDLYEVLVLEPWRRTTAHLLSAVPAAVIAGVLAAARVLHLATRPGAVSRPAVSEVATGPLVVLLAAGLAVFLARLTRSVAAGPLVLAALGVVTVLGALNGTARARWLAPVAFEDQFRATVPSDLLDRPAGLHLLYLLCCTAALAVGALWRSGEHRGWGIRVALAAALLGTTATALGQLRPLPDSVATARGRANTAPAALQECERKGTVTYCAFPEYLGRRVQWARVAERVLEQLPSSARRSQYFVRQHISPEAFAPEGVAPPAPVERWARDDRRARTPGAVVVGTEWGPSSGGGNSAVIGFAAGFAYRSVAGSRADDPAVAKVCGARGLVVLWLAAQATEETASALRDHASRSYGGLTTLSPLNANAGLVVPRGAVDMVLTLIDRPRAGISARIRASWTTLTDPRTSLDQAADILGVPAPRSPAAEDGPC